MAGRSEGKTLLRRKQELIENHPFWGRVLLACFVLGTILGILGGLVTVGEKCFQFYQFLTREDTAADIKIPLLVKNSRKTDIDLNPLCSFEVTERLGGSTTTYFEFGE